MQIEQKKGKYSSALVSFSGLIGGVVAPAIFHPLDLLRARLSSQGFWVVDRIGEKYKGVIDGVIKIAKQERLSGFYRGVGAAALGSSVSWAIYLPAYSFFKTYVVGTGPISNFTAGVLGGVVQVVCTNPIWLIKTRMQLQQNSALYKNARSTPIYSNFLDGLRRVVKEEGFRGLYRGMGPGLVLTTHGGIQFAVIEEIKKLQHLYHNSESPLSSKEIFFASSVGKVIATFITHPILVVRVRLQDEHNYHPQGKPVTTYANILDSFRKIWTHEGIKGYWKGLLPNLLKAVPVSATAITVADSVFRVLSPVVNK
eukprot:Phypoly_transcript_13644.p1 GENE.Phypoly_transcript_13644~~Phypoly_transcript_13644.p1  ORF type:complete len:312 (+),score=27.77 Phypoly_transcript_13644:100-1035(+)